MLILITLFVVIGGILAVSLNADTFSPGKLFLTFYVLFHAGAVVDPPPTMALYLMAVPLAVGIGVIVYEGVRVQYLPPVRQLVSAETEASTTFATPLFFWLLSLPAVFAQLYMIDQFGGLTGYVSSVSTRVVDWSGYGWARILITMMSAINVAFFATGLMRRRNARWWAAFAAHLAFVLLIGFLSGSRSGMLNVLALLVICLHYLRRPIGVGLGAGLVIALAVAASVLGVARNGFSYQNGELTTGLSTTGQSFSFNSFSYGVDPLELLVSAHELTLAHGSTFLSLFTNPIPRSIYPDKPDTGGVFFTKNYAGDAWEGLSNLTPTFLGEWIINFGWTIGIIGFFLSYALILFAIVRRYERLLRNPDRPRDAVFAIDVVIYIHVLWSAVGLMIGEVTNLAVALVLSQLLPLVLMRQILKVSGRTRRTGQFNRSRDPTAMGASQ